MNRRPLKVGFVILALSWCLSSTAFGTEESSQTLADRAAPLLARPGGLTSEEVARRAVQTSPTLKAREEATQQKRLGLSQARADFLPTLTTAASYTRYSNISPTGPGTVDMLENEIGFQASLSVPVSDYALRLYQAQASAAHLSKAATFDEEASRRLTAANARIAYYDWIRARIRQVIAEQSLEQANDQYTDVQSRHRVGSVILADVLQSQAHVKQAELSLIQASQAVTYTTESLRIAMHLDQPLQAEIGEGLPEEPPPAYSIVVADLQQEALAKRPELRAFSENEDATRFKRYVTQSGWYPRLDLKGNETYANPNARYFPPEDRFKNNWSLGAQLSWTPSSIPALAYAAAADRSHQRELANQSAALEDTVRLEVLKAQQGVEESFSAVVSTKQSLLSTEEAYRVRRDAFRVSKATLVELTDSETKLTRARIDALNARIDARVAHIRLTHATGRDLFAP